MAGSSISVVPIGPRSANPFSSKSWSSVPRAATSLRWKGRTIVVSGEKSETISVYAIDPASGALSLRQKYPTGKGSNWVEIVSFD